MDNWWFDLICFLSAFGLSAVYGYWLGGYAKRHAWDRQRVKNRASMGPLLTGLSIMAVSWILRAFGGVHHSYPFWLMMGFLLGASLTTSMVTRRARPGESVQG
jgi:hypothetical protein